MSHFIVGLTGGIGSGKTAVSDRFAKLGIGIVDADIIAREVVEPGTEALHAIAEHFGTQLFTSDGQLDRTQLRKTIFTDVQAKKWLESLLHPLIGSEIVRQLGEVRSSYALFVSPLLVESQQKLLCHHLVVVDVPNEVQIARTMQRDTNDRDQVERIIGSQADRQTRLAAANDVIDNTCGFEQLDLRVSELHQQFLTIAGERT
jgi:dephospho-CoA kinase